MGPENHPDSHNKPVEASSANDYPTKTGFVYLVKKNTINWNHLAQESNSVSRCYCGENPLNLEQSTKKRIMKVTEKEILEDFSKKAAKEEEIREKPVALRQMKKISLT